MNFIILSSFFTRTFGMSPAGKGRYQKISYVFAWWAFMHVPNLIRLDGVLHQMSDFIVLSYS